MLTAVMVEKAMTQDELIRLIDEAAADGRPTLNLAGMKLDELPPEIGKLTNLKTLVLGRWDKKLGQLGNNLKTLPNEIGQLTELRSLYLNLNQIETFPKSINQLQRLEALTLSNNQINVLPECIGQLRRLQTLDLRSNQISILPECIVQLKSLQALYLSNNQLSALPQNIGQLKSLQALYLSLNQINTLPKSIGQLQKLQLLTLSGNQLNALPEDIGQLQNLQSLDLSSNQLNTLPTSPEDLEQLQSLLSLNLSNNQLSTLPEDIGQLQKLQSLDLGNNQLNTLPKAIGKLQNLQSLDLSNNKLSTLPEGIGQLQKLQSLYLRYNQLNALPKWAKVFNKLATLDLRANPLPIPPEILGPKEPWQAPNSATETIGFYFSLQTETGSTPLYEAKLTLIGEGGAGKTSLAKKIENVDYELTKDEKSTEGIDVIRWEFTLPDGNTFRVNIWDFGGQEIYHATHQFFLTKRSLYLLVADTRQENTDFYYWLKIVELLADNSPVLIIKNEKQDRKCEIDEGLFKSQFNNLKESFPTNLKDKNNRGLDDIKDAIRYHISKLPHVGNPLPKIWVRVRAALENYSQNCNTLTVEQYCDICRQNGFTDKDQMLFLSSYLHDLGVCLHFQDDKLLKRTVILKPDWATTAVYKVADSNTVRNNKGRFTEADTTEIWSDSQYSDLRDELLQLMMRFKLAYELPNNPGNYIAPQLLPVSKPSYDWDSNNNLILRYRYDFMPKGILTRFIVETHQRIENQDHVWKNGVVLQDNWARAEVIENYPKNEITVRVSGTSKKPLLEVIRGELWKIHASYERLDYKELIPCNCPECKDSNQPEFYAYDLLMKYIAKRRYNIECRTSIEPVDVRRLISDITDQPQTSPMRSAAKQQQQGTISVEGDFTNSTLIFGNDNSADNL